MKLAAMPNNDNRYQYYRCHNPNADQYTNVYYDEDKPEHKVWLESQFNRVCLRDVTLPAWRLYQIVD